MGIWIKPGVSLNGLEPEMWEAVSRVGRIYKERGYLCWVTGGTELAPGRTPTSLHPKGQAIDFGTVARGVSDPKPLEADITAVLGPQYDVVLESDHIHVEFDPK